MNARLDCKVLLGWLVAASLALAPTEANRRALARRSDELRAT